MGIENKIEYKNDDYAIKAAYVVEKYKKNRSVGKKGFLD